MALEKLHGSNLSIRNNRNIPISNHNIPTPDYTPRRTSMSSSSRPLPRASLDNNDNDIFALLPEPLKNYAKEKPNREFTDTTNGISSNPRGQYWMNKQKKGVLLLVNITKFECNVESERRGAHYDTENLTDLFGRFNFDIFKFEDLTKNQFQKRLNTLLDSDYCKQTQCFVMVLMSHGQVVENHTECVKFYDNQLEKVNDIMANFSNQNCPTLKHKAKILFFPFCR